MKGWGRQTWSSSPVKLNSFFLSPLKVYLPHQSFIQSQGSNALYYLFADPVSLAHRVICYRGIVGWSWQGTFQEWNVVMQESRCEAIKDWGSQRTVCSGKGRMARRSGRKAPKNVKKSVWHEVTLLPAHIPKQTTKPQKEQKVQAGFGSPDRVEFSEKDTEAKFILIHSDWHVFGWLEPFCAPSVYTQTLHWYSISTDC